MRLILLGGPGSGKGTQGAVISERYSIPEVSTGDLFRKHVAEKTPLGQKADDYMKKGQLVPDELVLSMVEERLDQSDCANGYLLDGFPRTLAQAASLKKMLAKRGTALDHVVLIDVLDEAIVARLSARRTCSSCGTIYNLNLSPPKKAGVCDKCGGKLTQREDDMPETIRQRLRIYHQATEPLIAYYRKEGLVRQVDGSKSPQEVSRAIIAALGPAK